MAKKKNYTFRETVHGLTKDPIAPGATALCDPKDVEALLARGICFEDKPDKVAPKGKGETPPADDEQIARIVLAIRELDAADDAHWTVDGDPRVDVLEELLGHDITSDQRDEAWESVKAEDGA